MPLQTLRDVTNIAPSRVVLMDKAGRATVGRSVSLVGSEIGKESGPVDQNGQRLVRSFSETMVGTTAKTARRPSTARAFTSLSCEGENAPAESSEEKPSVEPTNDMLGALEKILSNPTRLPLGLLTVLDTLVTEGISTLDGHTRGPCSIAVKLGLVQTNVTKRMSVQQDTANPLPERSHPPYPGPLVWIHETGMCDKGSFAEQEEEPRQLRTTKRRKRP